MADFPKPSNKKGQSFTAKLDEDSITFFTDLCSQPFARQGVAFLNAYWAEVRDEAEFIYSVAWDKLKGADMHSKGISLVYKYDEGHDVDFDIGLYFYEQLCKYCEEHKAEFKGKYSRSLPTMMTAIKRKQELRDEVDVNFDGRVAFIEYLLYQYKDVANPADFCKRSMAHDEHPEIKKARLALEDVNKKIQAYEEEKARLETEAKGSGVKALGAKNLLAQIENSPQKEQLNKALITAEAAVRSATKKFANVKDGIDEGQSAGAVWWMNRELEEKQKRYAPQKKA